MRTSEGLQPLASACPTPPTPKMPARRPEKRSSHRSSQDAAGANAALRRGKAAADRDRRHDAPFRDQSALPLPALATRATGMRRSVAAGMSTPSRPTPHCWISRRPRTPVHQRAVNSRHGWDQDIRGRAMLQQRRGVMTVASASGNVWRKRSRSEAKPVPTMTTLSTAWASPFLKSSSR